MNRSTFPDQIDNYIEHYEISSSDIPRVERFRLLKLKPNRSAEENNELAQLTTQLRDKIILAEDWNKFQDSLVNMQIFIKDNVEGYILTKQGEFNQYIDNKELYINSHADQKVSEMTTIKNNYERFTEDKKAYIVTFTDEAVEHMKNRRDDFTTFVNVKEDSIRSLVQEFDSRTARFYQRWSATAGQTVFNIFTGGEINPLPEEAKLNINNTDLDIVIQGTVLTPNVNYEIVRDGASDKIKLLGNAATTIGNGTEIFARWHKNVGKLYFKHASTHALGGSDEITNIVEGQLRADLKAKINNLTVSSVMPTSVPKGHTWIEV